MLKKKIFIGVIALGIGSLAFAAGDTFVQPPKIKTFSPGIYVGLEGGYSLADWNSIDTSKIIVYKVKNHNDFGGRVYLGYDIIKCLALEAGYTQFFNVPELTNIGTIPVTTYQPSTWGTYAFDLDARLNGHIFDDFGVYAKAGGDYLSVNKGIDGKSHGGFNALFGAGIFYEFTPNFEVDFSWTRYNGIPKMANKYIPTYDLFAAGLSYKFSFS